MVIPTRGFKISVQSVVQEAETVTKGETKISNRTDAESDALNFLLFCSHC